MKRRVRSWFVILILSLGGCALGTGSASRIPQSTKPIVKIGLVAPFEGRYRTLGYEALYAVKWAVRQRNASGGVAGHMIELVALNDSDDPEASAPRAREFAVDAQVMGVVGPFSSAAVATATPAYGELGLAMVTPATCPAVGQGGDRAGNAYCLGASAHDLADALLESVPDSSRRVLFQGREGSLGEGLAPAVECAFDLPSDRAVRDLASTCPADVYFYDGDVVTAAELLIRLRNAGIQTPVRGGPSIARTQLPEIAGGAVSGTCYVITAPLLADLSPVSSFAAGYRELSGAAPGPWAALAYDAATLVLDALERDIRANGRPTRQGVDAQLAASVNPDGEPVFVQGHRYQAQTVFYCYDPGEPYPGHVSRR